MLKMCIGEETKTNTEKRAAGRVRTFPLSVSQAHIRFRTKLDTRGEKQYQRLRLIYRSPVQARSCSRLLTEHERGVGSEALLERRGHQAVDPPDRVERLRHLAPPHGHVEQLTPAERMRCCLSCCDTFTSVSFHFDEPCMTKTTRVSSV